MRRRIIAATFASLLLGGGLSFSLSGLTAADAVYASVQKAKSLAELLGQRSPGERTSAELTKTKRARALARHRMPAPKLGSPPSATELAKLLLPPATELPVEIANPLPLAQLAPPVSLAQIVGPGGGSVPILSPPGGSGGTTPGGGGGGPPMVTPPPSTNPVPAVPEPGTWAMMLLGFGFIGWSIRREKPVTQRLPLHA